MRRYAWAAIAVLALFAAACNVTESEEYQALLAERDAISEDLESVTEDLEAVTDELQSVTEQLATATGDLEQSKADAESLNADLTASQAQAESLGATIQDTRSAVEAARAAARADIFQNLWIQIDFYNEIVDAGVPAGIGDQLLGLMGVPWRTWEEFSLAPAAFEYGEFVRASGDDAAIAAWQRWFTSSIGSDEEFFAGVEVDFSLDLALLLRLEEALDALDLP